MCMLSVWACRPTHTYTCLSLAVSYGNLLSIPRKLLTRGRLNGALCPSLSPVTLTSSPHAWPHVPSSQITGRVGERDGAISAQDQGGAFVPAAAGHGHAPGPKHLPVSLHVWSPGARSPPTMETSPIPRNAPQTNTRHAPVQRFCNFCRLGHQMAPTADNNKESVLWVDLCDVSALYDQRCPLEWILLFDWRVEKVTVSSMSCIMTI